MKFIWKKIIAKHHIYIYQIFIKKLKNMNDTELQSKLGRLFIPDERDKKFQMKSLLPTKLPTRTFKYWYPNGWTGDQGEKPYCVAFSWTHWLAEGPTTQIRRRKGGVAPIDTTYLYNEAQKNDDWEGENYDGTSVRAGAKILQRDGFISSYNWAWDLETIKIALLTKGPVVVGTWWTYDMFFPNADGLIHATGNMMGGHAYLLDGINTKKKLIRIKNSWGKEWSKNGFAYISFDDIEKLILNQGEACLAVEVEKL